jgi:hypothetical protein
MLTSTPHHLTITGGKPKLKSLNEKEGEIMRPKIFGLKYEKGVRGCKEEGVWSS